MAVKKIEEPNVEGFNPKDLQNFIARTTFQGGEYLKVSIDITNTPFIREGSRLEVNGAFFVADGDEDIEYAEDIDSGIIDKWLYIYAVPTPEEESLSFVFDTAEPKYDDIKLGWYDGDKRAIAKIYKSANTWDGLYMLRYKESIQGMERPIGTIVTHIYQDMENELGRVFGGVWTAYPWKEGNANMRTIPTISKDILSINISSTKRIVIYKEGDFKFPFQRINIIERVCINTSGVPAHSVTITSSIRGELANIQLADIPFNGWNGGMFETPILTNFEILKDETIYFETNNPFNRPVTVAPITASGIIPNPSNRVEYLYIRIK